VRIALITDAWPPQINGVVTTVTTMDRLLREHGHEVLVIHPELFVHIPCPTYREIPLALLPGRKMARMLDDFEPEAVHIVNEGPVGIAARRYCRRRGLRFTTTFTSKYPEYIELRTGIPARWLYKWFLNFHNAAEQTTVATPHLEEEMRELGFRNMVRWERGVDGERFHPRPEAEFHLPRPIELYVGRVAVEKNLEAWLKLPGEGSKVVVGRGPALNRLQRQYPGAHFLGAKTGEDLAAAYAAGDVFVFPSLTDTFGLVLLEAMASGLPVAAFPVVGPRDVVDHGTTGWLDEDLGRAIREARGMDPEACRAHALRYPWVRCMRQLEAALVPAHNGNGAHQRDAAAGSQPPAA
jgi:glycosyltransferase involved in cell wall biosynthesis